jgi:site-specific recombinase XerC
MPAPVTAARGENHPRAKLSVAQVRAARLQHQRDGLGAWALARLYKVDRNTMRALLRRKTWKHVPAEPAADAPRAY